MSQDPNFVRSTFANIAKRYSLTNHIFTGGMDILWRRKVANLVAELQPKRILDLATGTGDLAIALEKTCEPGTEITAADFCQEMLDIARKAGVKNTMLADGMDLPFKTGYFDIVTCAWGLRNMKNWNGALAEMRRVLKPGGKLFILDCSRPTGLLEKPFGLYIHKILPAVAGTVTGNREAYEYLGESIEEFPSGQEMIDLLETVGFDQIEWDPLAGGVSSIYISRNPGNIRETDATKPQPRPDATLEEKPPQPDPTPEPDRNTRTM